jgi:hypothetical protein
MKRAQERRRRDFKMQISNCKLQIEPGILTFAICNLQFEFPWLVVVEAPIADERPWFLN